MSQSLHEVIIRVIDQASAGIKSVEKTTQSALAQIEKHQAGIQAIGIASGIAFAGMTVGIGRTIDASTELENSLKGLQSIVEGTNGDWNKAQKAIEEYTKDGLVSTSEAATSLKNLLSRGFNLEESIRLMDSFKNSATYGRQASLSLGEAVKTATEGIRNENSVLVDNAGVTKNVSVMWQEYADKIGKSVTDLSTAEKRQAEYNGILQETRFQMGDAVKMSDSYAGVTARMDASVKTMLATLGDGLKPVMASIKGVIQPVVEQITRFAEENPKLTASIIIVSTALVGVTAVVAGLALIMPSIIAGISVIGSVLGLLVTPIGLVVSAIALLTVAFSTNFLGIRDLSMSLVGWFETAFGPKIDEIFQMVGGIISAFKDLYSSIMSLIVSDTDQKLTETSDTWGKVFAIIKATVEATIGVVLEVIKTSLGIMKGTIEAITLAIRGDWSGAWEKVKETFRDAVYGIIDILLAWITPFIELVGGTREQIIEAFASIWEGVKAKTEQVFTSITSFISDKLTWVKNQLQAIKDTLREIATLGNASTQTYNGTAIAGARANGGPVTAGNTYLVGERGPELFTPSRSGAIIPNSKLGGNATPSITMNFSNITITSGHDLDGFASRIKSEIARSIQLSQYGIA